MRLIDKDGAIKMFTELSAQLPEPQKTHTIMMAMWLANDDEFPTIEAEPNSCEYWDSESHFCALRRPQAEPRKHGRWILNSQYGTECSECGTAMFEIVGAPYTTFEPNYCPNCGAIMDEVKNG